MQLVRSFKFLPFSSFLVTFVRRWWKKASLCVFLFIFPLVFRILSLYPIRDKGKKWKLKEIATLSSIELLAFVYCKITPLSFHLFHRLVTRLPPFNIELSSYRIRIFELLFFKEKECVISFWNSAFFYLFEMILNW